MDDVPTTPNVNGQEAPPPIAPEPAPAPVAPAAPTSTQPVASQEQPKLADVVQTEEAKPESVISYAKKRSFVDYFIIFVSIIAFLIWVAVGALYLQKRNTKTNQDKKDKVTSLSPTVTQPVAKKYNISTKEGNIININEKGEEEILVKKDDYKDTGIAGFFKVSVSPDQKMLCFESWPPSPQTGVYVSAIDGTNVLKASPNRKGCLWSSDSRTVAYSDIKANNKGSDLYIFDPTSSAETLLTIHTATETANPKFHTPTGWSKDNKKLVCEYSTVKTPTDLKACEVDIDTKIVSYN